jgi:hypothetical protein
MGALLWERAGVGGRPGGPRDTHWTVQEGPEEARPSRSRHTPPLRKRPVALGSARECIPQPCVTPTAPAALAPPGKCLGWGQLGQVQVAKNAPDDAALGEVRQHPPPSSAPRAGEDVHCERLAQQPRPIQPPGALTPPAHGPSCRI